MTSSISGKASSGKGLYSWLPVAAISSITLLGAWLRLAGLGDPSLWLDEILHYEIATSATTTRSWWDWIIGFEIENGPLFYALQLIGRASSGDLEFGARVGPALLGTVSIPLIWKCAGGKANLPTALAAAVLLTTSPLHIYYSREARPYSLTVFGTLLLVIALLSRTRSPRLTAGLGALVLAYAAASSYPILLSALLAAIVLAWKEPPRRRQFSTIAAMVGGCLVWCSLLYPSDPNVLAGAGMTIDHHLLVRLGAALTTSAVDNPHGFMYVALLAVVTGLAWLGAARRKEFIVLLFAGPICVFLTILALSYFDHWFSARYVINALPALLLAAGVGFATVARYVTVGRPAITCVLAFAATGAAVIPIVDRGVSETFEKLQWELVARNIAVRAKGADIVVTTNDWAAVCVRFYLAQLSSPLQVQSANESLERFEGLLRANPSAWILAAGFHSRADILHRIGPWQPILSSPIEDFRLYFHPSPNAFVSHRALTRDRTRYAESWGPRGRIEMRSDEQSVLAHGFYDAEHAGANDFRWARRTASVLVPIRGTAAIHARVLPVHEQLEMTVRIAGLEARKIVLEADWKTYELGSVHAADGVTRVDFEFNDSRSSPNDDRELSAAFDWISFDSGAANASSFAPPVRLAIQSPEGKTLPPESLGWRRLNRSSTGPREPDALRDRVARRLGFSTNGSKLSTEEMLLFHIAETAGLSDEEFIRSSYRLILDREADPAGTASYVTALRTQSRREALRALMKGALRSLPE